jgi:hypothetical protein
MGLVFGLPCDVQGFSVGPSPHLEAERAALEAEKAKHIEMQHQEVEKIKRTVEDQLRAELDEMLAAHASGGWRAIFCCCFPRKEVRRCSMSACGVI